MSAYIVQSLHGNFLRGDGGWSAEYPDAKVFSSLQAARRAVDAIKTPMPPVGIYDVEAYAMGKGPKAEA